MIRAVIIGASGRMGQAIVRAAPELSDLRIVGAVASATSSALGQDAGELAGVKAVGVRVTSDLPAALAQADVVIDFSRAPATQSNLMSCRNAGKPLLIGTTGFAAELADELDAAAKEIPLLVAPNTSIGVTLLVELVRAAAQALPAEFDIEIVEAHHRMKLDAPSGTALELGRAAAGARNQQLDRVATGARTGPARTGSAARREGDIGFAVVRGGDIVGDHTVLFAGKGERLSLSHQATDRAVFARGALQAAAWLASRPPGRYTMRDILGYKTVA